MKLIELLQAREILKGEKFANVKVLRIRSKIATIQALINHESQVAAEMLKALPAETDQDKEAVARQEADLLQADVAVTLPAIPLDWWPWQLDWAQGREVDVASMPSIEELMVLQAVGVIPQE